VPDSGPSAIFVIMRQIEDGTQLVLVVWGGILGGIGITIHQNYINQCSFKY